MSDNLENGSGLTAIISKADYFEKMIEKHLKYLNWEDTMHSNACDNSCANCLRTYQNIADHHRLDWKLALDLAELTLGRKLNLSRWFNDAEIFAEKFRDNFNKRYGDHKKLELEIFDQLPVLYDTTLERALVLSHPLWHNRILNVDQTNVKYQVEGIAANIKTEFVDIRAFRAAPHEQEVKFFD